MKTCTDSFFWKKPVVDFDGFFVRFKDELNGLLMEQFDKLLFRLHQSDGTGAGDNDFGIGFNEFIDIIT